MARDVAERREHFVQSLERGLAVIRAFDHRSPNPTSTSRIMKATISVGTRFPVYATSMGRVLLADLPADALDAYLERQGLRAVAARSATAPERSWRQ